LLENPADLRVRVTRELFSIGQSESQVASVDDGLVAPILEERLGHTSLHRKYRGAYLGRLFARDADSTAQLCCAPGISDDLHSEWERLYPPQLALDRARWQELEEERQTLRQFRDGRLSSPGGMIHYRGRRLSRNRLGAVLLEVDQECEKARLSLLAHERRARAVHLAMASQLDGGWEPYLRSLVSLIHYGCHAEANVLDALGHFSNVLSVVTADGRVTRREQARLVKAASEVYAALKEIYQHAPGVKLPPPVAGEMGVGAFAETLGGSLELRPPTMQNIGDWIEVVGSWVQVSASSLATLRLAALRELLLSEDQVAQGFRSGQVMIDAPVCGTVPQPYTTLMPGQERERQKKLGLWDRFVVADGMGPALARFTVALSVLFLVVGFTASEQRVTVSAYNGLGTEVTIQLGHEQLQLPAYGHKELRLDGSSELAIRTSVRGDVVESFNVDADRPFTHYVYNVAGLAPLATWTVHYGQDGDPALEIGRERWTETDAKHVFEDPPESVKTKSKASTRRVLSAPPPTMAPEELLDMVPVVERARIIEAHLRFDQGKARERWQSVNDSPQ
jgi:hypothetical protein